MSMMPMSVSTYLGIQIHEILQYGPLHALTWASKSDMGRWMQLSVHDNREKHYITVKMALPPRLNRRKIDRIFRQTGWVEWQVDRNDYVVYHITHSETLEELQSQIARVAQLCATAMRLVWGATQTEQVILLAARGPSIPLHPDRPLLPAGNPFRIAA